MAKEKVVVRIPLEEEGEYTVLELSRKTAKSLGDYVAKRASRELGKDVTFTPSGKG